MKKLAFTLLATTCAFVQTAFCAETNLNTSLIPINVITNSTLLQQAPFRADDFIVGIERITPRLHKLNAVYYKIDVRRNRNNMSVNADCDHHNQSSSSNNNNERETISFIATFNVTNPVNLGPTVYTLESIRRLRSTNEEFSFNN